MPDKSNNHEVEDYSDYKDRRFHALHAEADSILISVSESSLKIKDKKLLLIELKQKFEKEILTKI